ncbi:MAG TPA: cytochrome c oxidase subunit II [Iamia sp.]|nr:cytochrome c oxidase subunit II [Iamia sp.]
MRRSSPARLAALGVALAALGGAGCGMPDPITEQGEAVSRLWTPTVAAAVVVGAVVWVLALWSVVRYRRRNETLPSQVAEHIPIEIVYTVVPIVIVAILFVVGAATTTEVEEKAADPDVVVQVEGFQWSWRFTYLDEDVIVSGDGSGTDGPELVLPADRTTRLELVTDDVAHSFWVPEFLTKRDLIPGVDNEIDVTPTETGTYRGRCAEYCGLDHWRMYFQVRIVTPEEFATWLEENAGDVDPAAEDAPEEGEGAG